MAYEKNNVNENENVCPEYEPEAKVRIVPRCMADGSVYYEYEYYYEKGQEL